MLVERLVAKVGVWVRELSLAGLSLRVCLVGTLFGSSRGLHRVPKKLQVDEFSDQDGTGGWSYSAPPLLQDAEP